MTRALPRTNLNSSRLTRLLAELSLIDAAEAKQGFAERLGQWLDFTDAITLQAAHGSARAPAGKTHAGAALAAQLTGERAALEASIAATCLPPAGALRSGAPVYEPYRRFLVAQQGELELRARAWRARARQALADAGGQLRQLATLDGALEGILGARERQLLSTLPTLLEKRFARLASAPQQPAEAAAAVAPAAWLADFHEELKRVLLAELDLRLQPTVGLIEALRNEVA